jgi:O-antigen/teichoic acid export membrane protein
MKISRKNILLNLFWSTLGFFVGIIRSILLVPLFLTHWDKQSYGFWLLIFNFYALSIYTVEGYSRYTVNEYTKKYFVDQNEAYRYFGSGLKTLLFLSVACLALLAIVLAVNHHGYKLFQRDIDTADELELYLGLFIMFALALLHGFTKFAGSAIVPTGKIYVPERFLAFYVIVEVLVWLYAAFRPLDILSLFKVYAIALSSVCFIFLWLLRREYSIYRRLLNPKEFNLGWRTARKSLAMIFNNLCEKMTVDGLSLLVAGWFSAAMVPIYATSRTMTNLMVTGTNMVTATFTIEYQKHHISKDGRSLFNLFNATWLLVGLIINYGVVFFYPFIPDIFEMWTKGRLQFDPVFFNYLIGVALLVSFGSNIITYIKSVNKLRQVFAVSFARAGILLLLVLLVPKRLDMIGASLLITEFIINVLLLPGILYPELRKFGSERIFFRLALSLVPYLITLTYVLIVNFIPIDASIKMALALTLITLAYLLQIWKLDNESFLVRLQVLKYKLFNRGNR